MAGDTRLNGSPPAWWCMAAGLALLAAPADAQQGSEGSCPYYCKNWCKVATCSRIQCNPLDAADCPGSECVQECRVGVVGSTVESDDGSTALLFALVGGGSLLGCCVLVFCGWAYRHRNDGWHFSFHGHHVEHDHKRKEMHKEWMEHRKAKHQSRSRHARELEAAGKPTSAKQIMQQAMQDAMTDKAKGADSAAAPGSPKSPTGRSQASSPPGSPGRGGGSPMGSRSSSKKSARSPSKGSARGGSAADDMRIPSNRAFLRQIYEEKAALRDHAGLQKVVAVEEDEDDGGEDVEAGNRRSEWGRRTHG